MNETVTFVVKDQKGFSWPNPISGYVTRSVRQHSGWQSVKYGGKRYQVFGGIRNDHFIDLGNPLGRKSN